jgi:hypothetical protein
MSPFLLIDFYHTELRIRLEQFCYLGIDLEKQGSRRIQILCLVHICIRQLLEIIIVLQPVVESNRAMFSSAQ